MKNNIKDIDKSYVNSESDQNKEKNGLNQSLTGLARVSPPKEKRNHISNKIFIFINHNLNHRVTKDYLNRL
jgi:hypothetical protein